MHYFMHVKLVTHFEGVFNKILTLKNVEFVWHEKFLNFFSHQILNYDGKNVL